ncbi:PhnD/SsuA/transferrin family substrate-binding protein [uncultured Thermanaerothrix sp.]|uniref:phosphate/phosphite/phosphonate ABC transporter substrate-binding protein n=1 Tax=uncultured Thermanaerothrix sp. TaxID=1195149 RepID=UPI00261087F1|nr:PhnD/SsuA/transferrin family substrate-binding protein [uncultured Thermanaerothrix sp.]
MDTTPLIHIRTRLLAILCILLVVGLATCSSPNTPTPESQTPPPTITPTPPPLGHPAHPLVIGFVPDDPTARQAEAQALASALSERTMLSVQTRLFESYRSLLEGLEKGSVHAAFLPPLTYIEAHEKGLAQVELLANHFGVYFYGSMFLANAESNFTRYFDPATNRSTAPAETALQQLADLRPCWVEPTSIAGYLLPAALLKHHHIETLPGVIAQTPSAVVRALYIKGICDFGATFAISGDPRTASNVLGDLPDAEQRVIILWQTEPIIPNLNVSFHPQVSTVLRNAVAQSLSEIAGETELNTVLTSLNNGYAIQAFKRVDDSVYDPLRETLSVLSLDLMDLLGR